MHFLCFQGMLTLAVTRRVTGPTLPHMSEVHPIQQGQITMDHQVVTVRERMTGTPTKMAPLINMIMMMTTMALRMMKNKNRNLSKNFCSYSIDSKEIKDAA